MRRSPDTARVKPAHKIQERSREQRAGWSELRMLVMENIHRAHDVVIVVVFAGRAPGMQLSIGLIKRMPQSKHMAGLMCHQARIVVVDIDQDTGSAASRVVHIRIED